MKSIKFIIFIMLIAATRITLASEWINNVKVTQLGTYQHSTTHFVWLSSGRPNGCNGTLNFNESNPGGKSLMTVLTTAVISKTTVSVQVNGCDIIEVYLK